MAAGRKNPAAITLGREGGKIYGPARASRLTPEQRSQNAREAAFARWAKSRNGSTSKRALHLCLKRLKNAKTEGTVRRCMDELQRIVFHMSTGTPGIGQPAPSPIIDHLALRFREGRISIADFDKLHDWLAFDPVVPQQSGAKAFHATNSRR